MKDTSEIEIIDKLPIGILAVRDDAIELMNQTVRALFAGEFASLSALIQAFPGGSALTTLPRNGSAWINLGDTLFHVRALELNGERTLILLFPLAFMDPQDPELRELRERHGDFQEIFHNCFDGIYVADGAGRTLWMNEGFERAYGLSASDFIGRDARELERLGYIKPLITWKVITTKQRQSAVQRTKSGKSVLATGIPLFDDQGNVRKVIINSRDLTELVELQQRLSETEANLARTQSELARLRQESRTIEGLIWSSNAMQDIVDLALRLAQVDTTVLIQGESGVGKDVIARLLHAESARRDGTFVKINCGAIPAELLESELFGYEQGAFTGARKAGKLGTLELAHKGTLFLDEIGEMPPLLQVKLLQVLQDRTLTRVGGTKPIKVDFRLVAATNRDLKAMVRERTFREDLFYRLSVVPIDIPALRERPEDIIPLAHRFLQEVNARYGFTRHFSGPIMERMIRHAWPGNVRELRNIVERLAVTAPADEIGPLSWPPEITADPFAQWDATELKTTRIAHEVEAVRAAVERLGSIGRAAAHLGVSASTVKRRLRQGRQTIQH